MSDLLICPATSPFSRTISPPGSKSLTNRALVLAALAKGKSLLKNVLFADDTEVMLDCLSRLGFALEIDRRNMSVAIEGRDGVIPSAQAELFCGNSGTTIRFVSALATLGKGRYTLDGVPRMRQRPIRGLVDVLRNLGARVHYLENEGFPPIEIAADGLPGGTMQYGAEQSSQYLSAVLMAAPYARMELRVDLIGQQTSWPYVAMTMQLMDEFRHTPELERDPAGRPTRIVVPRGSYVATEYAVEPDASGASYFLAMAAIHPGSKVTIQGLGKRSLQGDVGFADILHQMGADLIFGKDFITIAGSDRLEGVDVDLLDMPDMAQTLAVAALFAKGPTLIRGLHTLKVKETDRIAALATELTKLGATVESGGDYLAITPPARVAPASIATYDDHRMAMSFAVAGTKVEGITIQNVECVNKTYPGFWDDLAKATTA